MMKNYDPTPQGFDDFMNDAKQMLNLKDLGKDKKIKFFKKKSEIFADGNIPASIFMVKSGNVKVFKSHADGKDLIINLYKENDYFGFEPILANGPYTVSAVALEDSELVIIPKQDFLTLLNGISEVSRTFISLLCQRVREKESQLLNLAYNSVRQRTADALLKVYRLKEVDKKLSISRDDLAKMVGTASESVIRVLSEFKDEGVIEIETGKIMIVEAEKLEKIIRWNVARD
jgi:CRP-like cAMP-binding protein